MGVVSWWCCGCRVLVVLWVSCPVVVLSSQRGKDTGRRAEPYGAPEQGQYPHIWLYVFNDLTFERQVILTLCIHLSCVFLRLKRDFFFATVSGFKFLPRSEHASTVIECCLRFFFATVSGFKILPCSEHASTVIECCLRFYFVAVSGIKILPRSQHASTVHECCLRFFFGGGEWVQNFASQ